MKCKEGDSGASLELVNAYNESHIIKRFYQLVVKLNMFLYQIDPFSIYKTTNNMRDATRFRLYQDPALCMKHNLFDRWRDRWRTFTCYACTYLSVKFGAIVVLQIALYLRRRKQQQQNLVLAARPGDQHDWLGLAGRLLGDPLIESPGMSIFLYTVIGASLSYAILYLPHYYRLEPMDAVNIRLWLEPAREFKRIDLTILETLQDYSEPFRRFCCCSLGNWQRHSPNGPHFALIASREIQAQIMAAFRSNYWHLRPIIYTNYWNVTFHRFTIYMSIPVTLLFVVYISYICRHLLDYVSSDRTISSIPIELRGYTYPQLLTLLETLSGCLLVISLIVLLIMIFLCNCFAHLFLLRDIRSSLLGCLEELKQMRHVEGTKEESQRLTFICVMLQPLIRVSLSLEELRKNARFLTEIVSVNVFISSTTCLAILVAASLEGQDLELLRMVIVGGLWLWANLTFIGCAYFYNSASKLERITWSLVAEIRSRESNKDWLMFEFQVAELWRRLIFTKSFTDCRMSVKPFGASLTYDRALQLNFLIVSLIGLLKTSNWR